MRIVGIGIDLVKVQRIEAMADRWRDRFLSRVYTLEERQECLDRATPYPSLAGRFAAKEAILKALGTGWSSGIRWVDIRVTTDASGKPLARAGGQARVLLDQAGVRTIHLSLSHDGEYAIAQAILVVD